MNFTESNVYMQTHILPFVLAQWDCNPTARIIMENNIPRGIKPEKMALSKTPPDTSHCYLIISLKTHI